MARKLPWLSRPSEEAKKNTSSPTLVQRRRQESSSNVRDHENDDSARSPVEVPRMGHNASSSPPPATPEEVYMQDGIDADDAWRLVEDEFEVTARLFTRHLHHAEYQRQKKLAKTRNQGAVDAITRSTDASSAYEKRRRKQVHVDRLRSTDLDKDESSDVRSEELRLKDPRLAGLMNRRQNNAPLAKIGSLHSTSRAARGFSQGQPSPPKRREYTSIQEDDCINGATALRSQFSSSMDEYSEDLDIPPHHAPKSYQAANASNAPVERSNIGLNARSALKVEGSCTRSNKSISKPLNGSTADVTMGGDDDDDDDDIFDPLISRRSRPANAKILSSNRPRSGNTKREENATMRADEIPTFLV